MKAKSYYSNMIANNRSFSWNIINEITGRLKKDDDLIIQNDGKAIFDKREIANIFQKKFTSFACNTQQIKMNYLGEPLINSIMFHPVTESEIVYLMNDLSLKKAIGSDGLSVKVWKDNVDILAPVLAQLVNDMLDSATYPDVLKIAKVKPIYKNVMELKLMLIIIEGYRFYPRLIKLLNEYCLTKSRALSLKIINLTSCSLVLEDIMVHKMLFASCIALFLKR